MVKNKNKSPLKLAGVFLVLVGGIVCFLFFQIHFRYHFLFIGQNQLFIPDTVSLSAYFRHPAWLACMAGEWAQQFYCYDYGGPAVLTVSLLIFGLLIASAIHKALENAGAAISGWVALSVAVAVTAVEARLFLYENSTLATLYAFGGGLLFWLAFRRLTAAIVCKTISAHIFYALLCAFSAFLCWWCFGYGALAFLILEFLFSTILRRVPSGVIMTVLIALCTGGMLCGHYRMEAAKVLLYPGLGKWVDAEKARGVEALLTYDIEYARGNYRDIINLYEHSDNAKIPEMSFYYSASAAHLGILPDKLLNMKKPFLGTFIHLDSKSNLFTIAMAGELYYLIGDMTYAERAFMHANNFSPTKRCARYIKRLAETALISGDCEAAEKYLTLLRKSFVYRKWADDHTPECFSDDVRREIEYKRAFQNKVHEVRIGDNCHTILCGLLDSNKGNTIALDYLLCTDIIANQKGMFLRDYKKYGPRDAALYKRIVK